MKLSIIGTGYIGLVTGTCFAEMGNSVICADIDAVKIEKLKQGVIPIYEPGLEDMVRRNQVKETLSFTTDIKNAVLNSEVCFIAVGTPMSQDGSADLNYVFSAAQRIGESMMNNMIIVNKSTVPVGTAVKVREIIQGELDKRNENLRFDVVSNPEFLKEGAAINDFMHPDRVIVGTDNERASRIMRDLYSPFMKTHDRFIGMDIRSSEMTKYAANAMLATKISFINEIANICERVGADVNKVRIGIGSDKRIGYSFIYPGCGYGGSCFPKDVRALMKTARDAGYVPKILSAVEEINNAQKKILVEKIIKRFGPDLGGHTFALWGLSFKPETDDVREASSLTIIEELTKAGAYIKMYDPKAISEGQRIFQNKSMNIQFCASKYDTLTDSDAMILVTEWTEFRSPDFDEIKKRLKRLIIFDGRNQYNKERLTEMGFEYWQIGVGC
ncbi:MAG: UDP-glucose/GDP-mannose dehydrogenase family protein [Spirochaetota bacterium]